jgi:hypothetical protein
MKKTLRFILLAAASTFFAACGGPAANTGANNANTNTIKPVAAAPTADALMALDKQANEAYVKGDSRFFEGMLSDKFVILTGGGQRMDKAATVKMIAGVKCDIKSMDLTEPAMSMIDADTYALSYKATWDGTCNGRRQADEGAEPGPFGQHLGPQRRQMAGGLPRREFDRRSEESAKGRTGSSAQKKRRRMTRLRPIQIRRLTPLVRQRPRPMPRPALSSRSNSRYGKHGRHTTPKSSTL